MKVLWICGLPDWVRRHAMDEDLSPHATAAWSWILGHLPPPAGVELHFFCPVIELVKPYIAFDYGGANWHCFRQPKYELLMGRIRTYWMMRPLVKEISPDVIDGWGGESGCGLLATYFSRKSIVHVQGLLRMLKDNMRNQGVNVPSDYSVAGRVWQFFEAIAYRRAQVLCTESVASHDGLLSLYGRESRIIRHPLREAFLQHDIPMVKPHVPTFLYIGEMIARKGTMDALHAFLKMRCSNARLTMVGSGELDGEVDDFIARNKLSDRIVHLRQCSPDEILKLMDVAQFFLLPSYGDTGPTALKEALSQGLYPICYDNTGPHALIGEYGFGRLCKTGSVDSLTQAMDEAADSVHAIRSVSTRVIGQVRRDLSKESAWGNLMKLYAEVLSS